MNRNFPYIIPGNQKKEFNDKLKNFINEFNQLGLKYFGEYFNGFDNYIQEQENRTNKDDSLMLSAPLAQYFAELVDIYVINEGLREKFKATEDKILILPPCLSKPLNKCLAYDDGEFPICLKCSPECPVNEWTELGEENNFDVYLAPDDLNKFLEKKKSKRKGTIGVIGVSCMLTLLQGIKTAVNNDVIPQGVILNYPGCHHWFDSPVQTDTDWEEIKELLGI
jgi:uncharacterized protein